MSNTAKTTESAIDFKRLLKLRLLVARFGEMDHARWWNTQGVLARVGQVALKRGFPKTHVFAQARLVFTVAAHRCQAVFDPPRSMTLWKLPAETEDRFEAAWSEWLDEVDEWSLFLGEIQVPQSSDLLEEARRLGIAEDETVQEARQLRRSAENRAVPIPGEHQPSNRILTLLGLGFFRGEPGSLAVPYAHSGS